MRTWHSLCSLRGPALSLSGSAVGWSLPSLRGLASLFPLPQCLPPGRHWFWAAAGMMQAISALSGLTLFPAPPFPVPAGRVSAMQAHGASIASASGFSGPGLRLTAPGMRRASSALSGQSLLPVPPLSASAGRGLAMQAHGASIASASGFSGSGLRLTASGMRQASSVLSGQSLLPVPPLPASAGRVWATQAYGSPFTSASGYAGPGL